MHFSLVYKELECIDLKEKNRKQMCDQIKEDSIQSSEKIRMQDTQQFQIDGSEKKQDHIKIVLTCNTANYKDIQKILSFYFQN